MKLEEHENEVVKIRSHFSKTFFFVYSIGIITVLFAKLKGISLLLSITSMCWYLVILNESWFLYFYMKMKQKNVTRWIFCDSSQIEWNNALIGNDTDVGIEIEDICKRLTAISAH